MPSSIISNMSYNGARSGFAAGIAKEIAHREVALRIKSGNLNPNDSASIDREYRAIYTQEYYKYYALSLQHDQQPRIQYVVKENIESRRYFARHTVVNFSKMNCFIHVHRGRITVGRVKYSIDDDSSLDTKEAFLTEWPGPLDQTGEQLKRDVTDYIDTLWQHDSQRRIKYANHDDHRKTIIKLLTELLHRNGTITAPGITRLLLRPEQTDLQREEGSNQPLEILKKYLLLGKRSEAIKFARSKKLWDHAQCLAFLDKYQPPNSTKYIGDGSKLKDDSIVQLNEDYLDHLKISSENQDSLGVLHTVYRSLLNRVLQSDPNSVNIAKYPNVENDPYMFALLSANDCEMEFDQTNEIFRLIVAIKQAIINPMRGNSHLISLGLVSVEGNDTSDDLSYRSNLSIKPGDTSAMRTLTISNIDMLILNEIWEYCLNLASKTCDPHNYRYLINLVPYKLVFATRIFDFGMHHMFYNYLCSIKNALAIARSQAYAGSDPFYDWATIEKSVEYLDEVWSRMNLEVPPQPMINRHPMPELASEFNPEPLPPQPADRIPVPAYNENFNEPFQGTSQYGMMPIYSQGAQVPQGGIAPIPEEVTDFNPDPMPPQMENQDTPQPYNDYLNESTRRTSQSMDAPVFSPPSFGPPGGMTSVPEHTKTTMKSSSPNRESQQPNPNIGESFSSPFSPINQFDDLPRRSSDFGRRDSNASDRPAMNAPVGNSISHQPGTSNSSNNGSKSQPSGDQQPGFLNTFLERTAALLPRSNSKQMKLPDDDKPAFVYDDQRGWVDTTNPDGVDSGITNDAPPMMDVSQAPRYSFPTKSSSMRYPKAPSGQSSRANSSAQFN